MGGFFAGEHVLIIKVLPNRFFDERVPVSNDVNTHSRFCLKYDGKRICFHIVKHLRVKGSGTPVPLSVNRFEIGAYFGDEDGQIERRRNLLSMTIHQICSVAISVESEPNAQSPFSSARSSVSVTHR